MLKEEEIPEVDVVQGHVFSFSQPIKHSDCFNEEYRLQMCLILLLFYELSFPSETIKLVCLKHPAENVLHRFYKLAVHH